MFSFDSAAASNKQIRIGIGLPFPMEDGAASSTDHLSEPLNAQSHQQERENAGPWMDNVNEMKRVCGLSAPNMAVNLFDMGIVLVSLLFVGRIGELELAGASLAITMANSLGYFVLMGMAGALETLCGQAYGAKAYPMLGIYLQQAVALAAIMCIPLSFLFIFTKKLLLLLGQNPAMSAKAKEFIVWLIPSLFANALVQPLLKFLQTQGVVFPSALFSAVSFGLHILFSWLFVHKLHVGFHSVALSTSICFWIKAVLLVLYVCFSKVCKQTWKGLSSKVLCDVKHFLKLSILSAFMVCLEYWTFEILVLLAGLLPQPQVQVSTLSICNSMATFNYMITLGLSLGVSIRVSNELGARNPQAAKLAVFVVLVLAIAEVFIAAAFLLMVHKSWGWVFTSEPEVVDNLTSITPFLALWILIDGTQCVLQGVVRGCGRQNLGAMINMGAFYLCGLPVGVVLGFVLKLRTKGLLAGTTVGFLLQLVIYLVVILRTDWRGQAVSAVKTLASSRSLQIGGHD